MPNTDRLLAEGTSFRQTSCNSPLCTPSRACLWSGRLPHQTEAWNFHQGLAQREAIMTDPLQEADYFTGVTGWQDYRSRTQGGHDDFVFVTAWLSKAPLPPPAMHDPRNEAFGRIIDSDDPLAGSEEDFGDLKKGMAWMDAMAHQPQAQPFFFSVGINIPHVGFAPSRYWYDQVDADRIVLPPRDESRHPVMEHLRQTRGCDQPLDDEYLRHFLRRYYAKLMQLDYQLGLFLDHLDRTGLADDTLFILSSDHGELNGEHNLIFKVPFYEGSCRVPLILRGPGVKKGQALDTPASLLDIFPTVLDAANAPMPTGLDGRSLMPECRGEIAETDRDIIGEYMANDLPCGSYMLRDRNWKYIAYPGYAPQLFDLSADPDELNDLAAVDPERVASMDARLRERVDYEQVEARVERYAKNAFQKWTASQPESQWKTKLANIYGELTEDQYRAVLAWAAEPVTASH